MTQKKKSSAGKQVITRLHKQSSKPPINSTRERILAHLSENRTTSAVDLAYAWGLTRSDLRYHLSELLKENLIEPLPRDPSAAAGPGRPIVYYRLSERTVPHPLAALSDALLSVTLQPLLPEARTAVLKSLASHLAGDPSPPAPLTRRLAQAVQHFNHSHYHARWEAHAQGPRVLFRRCPYASILANHPDLCQMDKHLLENLLQVPVKQLARMNFDTGQPPACIFACQPSP
jgi:predicted ArsR family transcriptional regulator